MSKDSYWFRHDSNARNDVNMIRLRRVSGMEGVGAFWCIIEALRESKGYMIPLSSIEDVEYDLRITDEIFKSLFECNLLAQNEEFFFSNSLLSRMAEYDIVKEKRREAGAKGGKAKASAKQVLSKAKAKPSDKSRVDKSRVEENIKEDIKDVHHKNGEYKKVLLTTEQLEKLKLDFSNWNEMIKNLDEYIETTGKKYKNHNLVMRKWAKNPNGSKPTVAQKEKETQYTKEIDISSMMFKRS